MNLSHFPQTPKPEQIAEQAPLVMDFPVVRFMNWQQTNFSKWAKRPLIQTWDDLPKMQDEWQYTVGPWDDFRGVPLDLLVDFVNHTGNRGWFCIPHSADNKLIEQITEWLIKKCDKRPILEFSNEIWNNTFAQHEYAVKEGESMGLGKWPLEAALKWQAQRTFLMAEAASGAADVVISTQFFNPSSARILLDACGDSVDALAAAPYIGRKQRAITPEGQKRSNLELLKELQDEIHDEVMPLFSQYNELSGEFGIKLYGYEGGLHQVARNDSTPENWQAEKEQFADFNRSDEGGEITGYLWSMWQLMGGDIACPYSLATLFKNEWDNKLESVFFGHYEIVGKELVRLPKYEAAYAALTAPITDDHTYRFFVNSDDEEVAD